METATVVQWLRILWAGQYSQKQFSITRAAQDSRLKVPTPGCLAPNAGKMVLAIARSTAKILGFSVLGCIAFLTSSGWWLGFKTEEGRDARLPSSLSSKVPSKLFPSAVLERSHMLHFWVRRTHTPTRCAELFKVVSKGYLPHESHQSPCPDSYQ